MHRVSKAPVALRFSRGRAARMTAADEEAILAAIEGVTQEIASLRQDMRSLENTMDARMASVKHNMDTNMRIREHNMDAKIVKFKQEMTVLYSGSNQRQMWAFGVAGLVTLGFVAKHQ